MPPSNPGPNRGRPKMLIQHTKLEFLLPLLQQPLAGHDLLNVEASRSHSVRLLWTSDQPDAETSNWLNTTLTIEKTSMHPAGFEPVIPKSKRPQTHALAHAATETGK